MIRPWHIAAICGTSLVLLLAAMGWISWTAVNMEQAEAAARQQATLEESVRLALWRMDSALATLIAPERARPYFAYAAFYPAEAAYTRMFSEDELAEVLVPSPLLTQTSPYVLLYFQLGPRGEVTSPEVPAGQLRALAEKVYASAAQIERAAEQLARFGADVDPQVLRAVVLPALAPPAVALAAPPPAQRPERGGQQQMAQPMQQSEINVQEFQARKQALQQRAARSGPSNTPETRPSGVSEGVLQPLWINGLLVLARRVAIGGEEYVQGCWLDWDALRPWLLSNVSDLLPGADLQPAPHVTPEQRERLLAGLPVRLVPGASAVGATPIRPQVWLALVVAWVCVLLASGAVAALLVGTVALSERRAAFVSAVTHEMRTPLTTFRLYTDMLASGMIADVAKRQSYLQTLQTEALRLGHLIENVLAYARLERRRWPSVSTNVSVPDVLEHVRERLCGRAVQAGMELIIETPGLDAAAVRVDLAAVEQILFNLVDNACKYAAGAADQRIRIDGAVQSDTVALRVADHGPGIASSERRRLFRPFHKSARDAANSAPGVGLGLALSRRLARSMGGDLRLVPGAAGACFELTLPRATLAKD